MESIALNPSDHGIVLTSHRLIPYQNGQLQPQYAVDTSQLHDDSYVAVAFATRSLAKNIDTNSSNRQINEQRLYLLDSALESLGISPQSLRGRSLVGTAPQKVYHAFISPKTETSHQSAPSCEAKHQLEAEAARRTAHHIQVLLQRLHADQSTTMRNADFRTSSAASPSSSALSSSADTLTTAISTTSSISSNISDGDRMQSSPKPFDIVIVMDNLRSALNVGSICRSAEAAGCSRVMSCGISPAAPHPKVLKTSLGACQHLHVQYEECTAEALRALKEEGYRIIAMETTSTSIPYHCDEVLGRRPQPHDDDDAHAKTRIALVVGNEDGGIGDEVRC